MNPKEAVIALASPRDLTRREAASVMRSIMTGEATSAQVGAILTALSMKGAKSEELAGFAGAMREFARPFPHGLAGPCIDTCGTGGDESGTFNVSTAAAFVVAGAGLPVVKHGNRSVTSRCGSADVLTALGAQLEINPEEMAGVLCSTGIAFLYAPLYHPAMKRVAGIRQELGLKTIFNLLGPLTNPAGARFQLLGVYRPDVIVTMAGVLRLLGAERAMVVHGGGLDEITTTGPTRVAELTAGGVREYSIEPGDFGIPLSDIADLRGGDTAENARILREVLSGERGPARDAVLLNAGAAISIGGLARSMAGGIALAEESIDAGTALGKLEAFIRGTREAQA
ncbi:MAG TPA: anthranilate phosphoribosyltransferase [Methanomicrobiales archaeon]|jgi:anthranilate phosphoribosyltransferase|nr:anthranilate phosphoribosyltransferase [Methanomicrobiales archaeon]